MGLKQNFKKQILYANTAKEIAAVTVEVIVTDRKGSILAQI